MKKSLILVLIATVSIVLTLGACSKKTNETNANAAANEEAVKTDETKAEEAKAEEAKAEETEGDAPFNPEAEAADEPLTNTVSPLGTVLQVKGLPSELKVLSIKGTVHGSYALEIMIHGMVVISTERLESKGKDADSIKAIVTELEKDRGVQDMAIETSNEMKNIVLPTHKLTYRTGHNEDTRECRDYYIHGQEFDYRLHTSIPADFVDEYKGMVDGWVKDAELIENNNKG